MISSMEGTRPILLEVQSLICHTNFGLPRRMSTGIDYNKFVLLLAVVEKKCGINLSQSDVYLNIAGGLKVQEPAADLGIVSAVMSGYLNVPISNDVCFSGEVGLTGEVRAVSNLERRISEAKKMGFKTIFVPYMKMEKTEGINVIRIKNIIELMDIFKN